jgi:hypothetical protein
MIKIMDETDMMQSWIDSKSTDELIELADTYVKSRPTEPDFNAWLGEYYFKNVHGRDNNDDAYDRYKDDLLMREE